MENIKVLQKERFSSSLKIAISIISFYILFAIKHFGIVGYSLIRENWYVCMEYLSNGILYSGQPVCVQGPLLYSFLELLRRLVSPETFIPLISHLAILSNIVIFYYLLKINKLVLKKEHFWKTLALYCLLPYYLYLTSHFEVILSSLVMIIGIYLNLKSETKKEKLVSSVLLTLPIFIKSTNIFIPLSFGIYESFKPLWKKKITKERLKESLISGSYYLIPLLLIFLTFLLFFPNFPHYTGFMFGENTVPDNDFIKDTLSYISTEPIEITLLMLVLISIASAVLVKTKINIITAISLIITLLMVSGHTTRYRFAVIPIVLSIHALISLKKTLKKQKLWLFTTIILILLSPSIYQITIDTAHYNLVKIGKEPLSLFEGIEDKLLVQANSYQEGLTFAKKELNKDLDNVDVLFLQEKEDKDQTDMLISKGMVTDIEGHREKVLKEKEERLGNTLEKISKGTYSMIVFGPAALEYEGERDYIDQFRGYVKENNPVLIFDFKSLSQSQANLYLISIGKEQNKEYQKTVIDYYDKNFQKICSLSQITANNIGPHIYSYLESNDAMTPEIKSIITSWRCKNNWFDLVKLK